MTKIAWGGPASTAERANRLRHKDLLTLGWPTLALRRRRSKLLLFWQLVHGQNVCLLTENMYSQLPW